MLKFKSQFFSLYIVFFLLSCTNQSKEKQATDSMEIEETAEDFIDANLTKSDTIIQITRDNIGDIQSDLFNIYLEDIDSSLTVIILELDSSFNGDIVGMSPNRYAGISLITASNTNELVIGSGFVNSYSPIYPKGLLIIDGDTISKFEFNGYKSIILSSLNKLEIQNVENSFDLSIKPKSDALQVGPLLVEKGKEKYIRELNPDATRAFFGVTKKGKYIIGITMNELSLNALAKYLSRKCITCTNLSGGGSEGIVINTPEGKYAYGNIHLRQASLIGFNKSSY